MPVISVGAQYGLEDFIHYDQTKCYVDLFLKDLKAQKFVPFWLETCNVHAVACACEAVGGLSIFKHQIPMTPDNKPLMTQAGLMFAYLYSEYGQAGAPVSNAWTVESEVMANLAWVAQQCAFVKATIREYATAQAFVDGMQSALSRGSSLVLSYFTDYRSGHYHTVTRRSVETGMFVAYDSWPGNQHCKNKGIRELYSAEFYKERCSPSRLRFLEISKPGIAGMGA